MSSLETELRALSLLHEADLVRDQIVEQYGVGNFDQLPPQAYEEFDLLMSAAGWINKTNQSEGDEND